MESRKPWFVNFLFSGNKTLDESNAIIQMIYYVMMLLTLQIKSEICSPTPD